MSKTFYNKNQNWFCRNLSTENSEKCVEHKNEMCYIIDNRKLITVLKQEGGKKMNCQACNGNGEITCTCNTIHPHQCDHCHGEGIVECPRCNGSGLID